MECEGFEEGGCEVVGACCGEVGGCDDGVVSGGGEG